MLDTLKYCWTSRINVDLFWKNETTCFCPATFIPYVILADSCISKTKIITTWNLSGWDDLYGIYAFVHLQIMVGAVTRYHYWPIYKDPICFLVPSTLNFRAVVSSRQQFLQLKIDISTIDHGHDHSLVSFLGHALLRHPKLSQHFHM